MQSTDGNYRLGSKEQLGLNSKTNKTRYNINIHDPTNTSISYQTQGYNIIPTQSSKANLFSDESKSNDRRKSSNTMTKPHQQYMKAKSKTNANPSRKNSPHIQN